MSGFFGRAPFRGCKLTKSGTQSLNASQETTISWSAATFDTDGFWTSGTDIVIPAGRGIRRVWVGAQGDWATATGRRDTTIRKNGSDIRRAQYSGADQAFVAPSAVFDVTDADVIILSCYNGVGTSQNFNTFGSATIELVVLG